MDFADAPEDAAFRREFRAWLDANLTDDLKVEDAQDQRVSPDRETLERRRAWQKKMHAAGWIGIAWPKEYGGRGAGFMQQVIFDEEYFRARAPILPGTVGMSLLGPDPDPLGHRGTEEALSAENPVLRRNLVPGLFRAGRRLRSRRSAHPRRRQGRPFPRQRPEGVDLGRAFRRLVLSAGAHRSRQAEASRHLVSAGRYEDAGDHGAPAGAAERAPAFQRGVLRGCRRAEGEPRRAAQRGLEGHDDDA